MIVLYYYLLRCVRSRPPDSPTSVIIPSRKVRCPIDPLVATRIPNRFMKVLSDATINTIILPKRYGLFVLPTPGLLCATFGSSAPSLSTCRLANFFMLHPYPSNANGTLWLDEL